MKFKTIKFFTLVLAVASLAACSKKGTTKSKTELLTQSAWKYASAGIDTDKNGTVDVEDGSINSCEKDNSATFITGGTGSYDEGATKCSPSDPQTTTFTWQFKNEEKELEFDGDIYQLLSIDENNIKLYYDIVLGDNTTRFLVILKH